MEGIEMRPGRSTPIAFIGPVIVLATSAFAAQWEIVIPADDTNGTEIAIDMESLSIDEGRVGVWSRTNFSELQSLKVSDAATSADLSTRFRIVLYRSTLSFSRYRCEARQRQTVEFLLYGGPNLSGDQAFSSKSRAALDPAWRNFDVEEIRPGTPAEVVLFAVCEAAVDRGLLKGRLPWTRHGRSISNANDRGASYVATAVLLLPAALVSFLLVHILFQATSKRNYANWAVLAMLLATWILTIVVWITSAPAFAELLGAPHDGVVMFVVALVSSIVIKFPIHFWRTRPN